MFTGVLSMFLLNKTKTTTNMMKLFSNLNNMSLVVILLSAVLFGGCACGYVQQGYTGIEAENFGTDRGGVEERGPGRYIYTPWNVDFYYFPNFVQTVSWTEGNDAAQGSPNDEAFRILSGDQLEFTVDLGISYFINPLAGCSADIFQKYRKPIEVITSNDIRLTVRDDMQEVLSQYTADHIYGSGRPAILAELKTRVVESLSQLSQVNGENCFVVNDLYLMRLDPPNSVKAAVNAKIEQTQRAQQAVEETKRIKEEAEQARIRAEMEALNNAQLSRSLTPEILRNKFLDKWNGQLPTVMSDEAANILLQMN